MLVLGSLSHRADVMLDLVIDIKNNRLSKTGKKETMKILSPNIGRWLQELEVQKMALVHLTWARISDPHKSGTPMSFIYCQTHSRSMVVA